jgi:hypothetical protein
MEEKMNGETKSVAYVEEDLELAWKLCLINLYQTWANTKFQFLNLKHSCTSNDHIFPFHVLV